MEFDTHLCFCGGPVDSGKQLILIDWEPTPRHVLACRLCLEIHRQSPEAFRKRFEKFQSIPRMAGDGMVPEVLRDKAEHVLLIIALRSGNNICLKMPYFEASAHLQAIVEAMDALYKENMERIAKKEPPQDKRFALMLHQMISFFWISMVAGANIQFPDRQPQQGYPHDLPELVRLMIKELKSGQEWRGPEEPHS